MSNEEKKDKSLRKKAEFFDELSSYFYEKNFGSLSKTEFDLLMLRFYCELHQSEKSDTYVLSKNLGITQSRVANLLLKIHLKDKNETDWQAVFKEASKNIKYIEQNQTVQMLILDPAVFYEIEHQIEKLGGFVPYSLNKKILSLHLTDFAALLADVDPSLNKNARKEVKKLIREAKQSAEALTPNQLLEVITKKITEKAADETLDVAKSLFAFGIKSLLVL